MKNFQASGLPVSLVQSLERMHITTPTPVQAQSIGHALAGKDILASAQTGTGKTIAYLMPIIAKMLDKEDSTALILTPTRELAAQVRDFISKLFNSSPPFRSALLIGGDPIVKQFMALKRNPRMIIGTPGRIIDHLDRQTLDLSKTEFLVLDETDRMLDMGFTEPLKKIVQFLPEERQTMMFSATMPPSIVAMSHKYLTDPVQIKVGSSIEPVAKIKQESVQIQASQKFAHLLKELDLREGSVIIFVKTKYGADSLASKLQKENHEADAIHGDLRQRKREQVILSFRNQKSRIMVATDIAARGLDVPHVMHVINYDLPQCPHDYIHRIGRTGRAGAEGFALSMVSPEDGSKWRAISRLISGEDVDPQRSFSKPKRSGFDNKRGGGAAPRSNSFGGGGRSFDKKEGGRSFGGGGRDFAKKEGSTGGGFARRDDGNKTFVKKEGGNGNSFARKDEGARSFVKKEGGKSFGGGRDFAKKDGAGKSFAGRDSSPKKAYPF